MKINKKYLQNIINEETTIVLEEKRGLNESNLSRQTLFAMDTSALARSMLTLGNALGAKKREELIDKAQDSGGPWSWFRRAVAPVMVDSFGDEHVKFLDDNPRIKIWAIEFIILARNELKLDHPTSVEFVNRKKGIDPAYKKALPARRAREAEEAKWKKEDEETQ